jgi:tRNA A37 threonylcarbamoyladenosine dehydratase
MRQVAMMDPRFAGVARLYGADSVTRLASAHVAVIGVGGVGSWAAEALARSGVGRLTLIDADEVCVSNTNRQLHTLASTLGRAKVQVMAARLRDVSPALQVEPIERFLTPAALDELLEQDFDVVLDACDAFRVKVEMIAWCRRRKLPLVVCGSAGGRVDPTLIRVRDLSRTEHDALLSLVRRKLRHDFRFPSNPQRYFGVPAVYSLENVRYPQPDGSVCGTRPKGGASLRLGCEAGLGAVMHVTASFGLVAAGQVIERLLASRTVSDAGSRAPEQPVRVVAGSRGDRGA